MKMKRDPPETPEAVRPKDKHKPSIND
jgi:hypothetical protein